MRRKRLKHNLKLLKRLFRYAIPHWRLIILVMLATAIYGSLQAVPAFLARDLMDDAILGGDKRLLLFITLVAASVAIVVGVTCFIKEFFRQKLLFRIIVNIRQETGEYILRLSMGYFDKKKVGDLMSRLTNDINATRQALNFLTGDIIEAPLVIIASFGVAVSNCWQLALICLVGLPLILSILAYFGKRIKKHSEKSLSQLGQVTESMQQMISGVQVVKVFGLEKQKAEEFRRENESFFRKVIRMVRNKAMSRSLIEFTYMIAIAALVLIGGILVINGIWGLTLGRLISFFAALGTMYRPSKRLTKAYNTIQESLAGCERIFEMLDEKPEVSDAPDSVELKDLKGEVVFEDVWFSYGNGEPALKGVSFRVKPGEVLAVVGASGSGKSTIINLLLRLYDPQKGRILIDGTDVRKIKRRSLLKHLAVVTQEPFLFNTTVVENIAYGRLGATRSDVEDAARAAKVHDVIEKLPEGYETLVGERGSNLSGGEKQRITIARALLRNPKLLLLDEATSNLDSESEKAVQNALSVLMKGRTTIVVAHRLSTISDADRIIVIDGGKVVEEGTHEELMEAGGIYKKMFELQHRLEEVEAERRK